MQISIMLAAQRFYHLFSIGTLLHDAVKFKGATGKQGLVVQQIGRRD